MIKKLKKRWNIKSNFQLVVIVFMFTITGSLTVYIKNGIFDLIGVTAETSLLLKVPLYIITIFPAYQILLLVIGTIFGQFRFAWEFEKRMFARFKFRKL